MTTVHGMSLHYFDRAANHDKFYRAFIWSDGRIWFANYHWGRDGQAGMTKATPQRFRTRQQAQAAITKKVASKVNDGYQLLGEGTVDMVDADGSGIESGQGFGELLHAAIGVEPCRFDTIIHEVGTINDLVIQRS